MKVLITYHVNGDEHDEKEYISKYNRINAKGIRQEALSVLRQRLGISTYNLIDFDSIQLYRQD